MSTTYKAKVIALRKEKNSNMGNPTYTVAFANPLDNNSTWWVQTQANAGFVYAITDRLIGKEVEITVKHYKKYLRITDIKDVK